MARGRFRSLDSSVIHLITDLIYLIYFALFIMYSWELMSKKQMHRLNIFWFRGGRVTIHQSDPCLLTSSSVPQTAP